LIWRFRAQGITSVLDHPDRIEVSLAALNASFDREHIAAAGHSCAGRQ
jgi:hypothetical protein